MTVRLRSILLGGLALAATPALAQTQPIDLRVGKLEKEMRAVQRTVFPNGNPVQPDLSPSTASATPAGTPATAPIADLTARVDGLEKQMATLTGQVEQNSYRLRQADEAIKRLEARVLTVEGPAYSPSSDALGGTKPPVGKPLSLNRDPADGPVQPAAATAPRAASKTTTLTKPASPTRTDPARKAAVAAVEIPATGDAIEDEYSYGFRLYSARFYPEAQVKLKEFVAKYPATSKRWSYAQNLLGRAYYDDGKPALASVAFYDNYQKAPRGERAGESLYWLGQALTKLKKTTDACKVYAEFGDVFAAKAGADLRARVVKGRADARCPA